MRAPKTQSDSVTKLSQSNGSNFFSSGLRQSVDQLMDVLYAGGVNNPMDAIEQLSYLVFLRLLSERDEQLAVIEKGYKRVFSGAWAQYAWGSFVPLTGNELFDALRGAIERLHELPSLTRTGQELFRNATLKIYDRPTLRAVVQGIAEMDLAPHEGHDLKGDMYEYLLSKLSQSGTNGQFRTPRHIINLIVTLVDPQPGQRICDPACGTAGFLIAAYTHILRKHTKPADLKRGTVDGSLLKPKQWEFLEQHAFTGFDNDANMVKIAVLNLYLHQLERARIEHHNPLTTTHGGQYPGQLYDVILANPPFAGSLQKESVLADIDLPTRDTELLFVKWIVDHLSDEGRAGIIVPDGVITGNQRANQRLRASLLSECALEAVISLPAGVFLPYARAKTSILVFQKGAPTRKVWFFDLQADGYSLDDRRVPIEANDIPAVLSTFGGRGKSAQSVVVEVDDAEEGKVDLRIGKYLASRAPAVTSKTADKTHEMLNTAVGRLTTASSHLSAVAFGSQKTFKRAVPLGDWIAREERRFAVQRKERYRLLGVKWYGEGPFLREELLGAEIKAKYVFKVQPEDIIYNRLFAWKGSFGVVPAELDGCYVSNEFPLFRLKDGAPAYGPYIKYFLKSPATWATAERLSTGTTSTSRNRLSIEDFLGIEIPEMTVDEQMSFVRDCELIELALTDIREAERATAALLAARVARFS
ncbi:MAG: N-6 DNA methylase [Candidatus Kerfeldbacteria bacterium]